VLDVQCCRCRAISDNLVVIKEKINSTEWMETFLPGSVLSRDTEKRTDDERVWPGRERKNDG